MKIKVNNNDDDYSGDGDDNYHGNRKIILITIISINVIIKSDLNLTIIILK